MVYHHIEKRISINLLIILKFFEKKWKFITPVQFENHICVEKNLRVKIYLLTFDDGFKSNYTVEKNILENLILKVFFCSV